MAREHEPSNPNRLTTVQRGLLIGLGGAALVGEVLNLVSGVRLVPGLELDGALGFVGAAVGATAGGIIEERRTQSENSITQEYEPIDL